MHLRRSSLAVVLMLLFVMATPLYSTEVRATEGRSSTATTFTYVGEATSVQLIGEWDWNAVLEMNNSSGTWSVDVELSRDFTATNSWLTGPTSLTPTIPNGCDGIEFPSRVDNHLPLFTASLAEHHLHITYHAGSTGAPHDGTPVAFRSNMGFAHVNLEPFLRGLADGKHSLKIGGLTPMATWHTTFSSPFGVVHMPPLFGKMRSSTWS